MPEKETNIAAKNGRSALPLDLDEYLSAAQYGKIIRLAAEVPCDADQASRTLFGVSADRLSASGADDLIEYLERLKS